jgi:methylated-DNA-[protein]-cysteine S-methyltransferase
MKTFTPHNNCDKTNSILSSCESNITVRHKFMTSIPLHKLVKNRNRSYVTGFRDRVLTVVKTIPKGKTLTYKEVARRSGRLKAYRVVGNILNANFDKSIPCHRVIRSDGKLGGYNRGMKKKAGLLKREKAL